MIAKDSAIPLYSLLPEQREEVAGRRFYLPKAKGASEPFFYRAGSPPPVPHGTKISVWNLSQRDPVSGSYWVGCTSSPKIWGNSRVFRLRRSANLDAAPDKPNDMADVAKAINRVADALERIAQKFSNEGTGECQTSLPGNIDA